MKKKLHACKYIISISQAKMVIYIEVFYSW